MKSANRITIFIQLALAVIPLLAFVSCGIYETKNDGSNKVKFDIKALLSDPNAKITFSQINLAVFQTSCISCHNSASAKGGVILDSYANFTPHLNDVVTDIQTGDMPQNDVLTADQLALFNLWVCQGATEAGNLINNCLASSVSTPTPTPTPTPVLTPVSPVLSAVNYSLILDQIFAPKCLSCHGEGGKQHQNFPLEPYAKMMAQGELVIPGNSAKSGIVAEIVAGTMPTKKSGLPQVTDSELALIRQWIEAGAKE